MCQGGKIKTKTTVQGKSKPSSAKQIKAELGNALEGNSRARQCKQHNPTKAIKGIVIS